MAEGMAEPHEHVEKHAQSAEERLNKGLSSGIKDLSDVLDLLNHYRDAGLDAVFRNFPATLEVEAEERLWAAHSKVNNHFRKNISRVQRNKNNAVETRKLLKQYLGFLKSSQRFYRAFILRLDSACGGVPELRQVANNWTSQDYAEIPVKLEPETKQLLLRSCYQNLVHLGDLCRYREIEINKGQRNWGPAIGYYSLANEILPDSGVAQNQLAVVALADGNHLRAIYYLYRSLATKNTHPSAQSNLELEFKKVISAWERGERIVKNSQVDGHASGKSLIAWFVRLHSKCYKGQDFPEHDELMKEVLTRFRCDLKQSSMSGKLQMMVLINIAAEHFVVTKLQRGMQTKENLKAYLYFLELNSRFFEALLNLLRDGLHTYAEKVSKTKDNSKAVLPEELFSKVQTILPLLRIYSAWFVINWALLTTDMTKSYLNSFIKELWVMYAQALTLLATLFPAESLPLTDYMLEEDVDTIGFIPLISEKTAKLWKMEEHVKPKFSDKDVKRLTHNNEMLGRIRELLIDGLQVVLNDDSPLSMHNLQFSYNQSPHSQEPSKDAKNGAKSSSEDGQVLIESTIDSKEAKSDHLAIDSTVDRIEPASVTSDVAMSRMVDDLVGPTSVNNRLDEAGGGTVINLSKQSLSGSEFMDQTTYGISQLSTTDGPGREFNTSLHSNKTNIAASAIPTGVSPPPVRSFPTMPPLLDQSGIWNSSSEFVAPSSPFLDAQYGQSPICHSGRSTLHSRNPSLTSIGSIAYAAENVAVNGAWSPLLSNPNVNYNLRTRESLESLADFRGSYHAGKFGSGTANMSGGESPYSTDFKILNARERIPSKWHPSPFAPEYELGSPTWQKALQRGQNGSFTQLRAAYGQKG